jgi:dihydrodipicolinate synthase/N-acetylneuraminate lyase
VEGGQGHLTRSCVVGDTDRKYDVMQGYEFSYLPCLALGAKGFVGVSFSLCAPVYLRLDQAFREGDFATAQRLQLAVHARLIPSDPRSRAIPQYVACVRCLIS